MEEDWPALRGDLNSALAVLALDEVDLAFLTNLVFRVSSRADDLAWLRVVGPDLSEIVSSFGFLAE